jgi:hypothetical protein
MRQQLISGAYDKVFLPYLTAALIDEYRRNDVPLATNELPCGHYTLAVFPFNVMVAGLNVVFLRSAL